MKMMKKRKGLPKSRELRMGEYYPEPLSHGEKVTIKKEKKRRR